MASSRLDQAGEFVRQVATGYGRALHQFLTTRLRAGDDAEDIAQEVYLRLLKLDRTDLIQQPPAYLFHVARQVAYEHRQREAKQPQATDDDTLHQMANQEQNPMADEMVERVHIDLEWQRLMDQLDSAHQQIYTLKHRDGYTVEQIATLLDLPVWSVKRHLGRAQATLKEHSTRGT